MRLNVPLIRQKNRFSCGIISTYMVLKYKGYDIELEKLFDTIPYGKKRGDKMRLPVISKYLKFIRIR